MFKVVRLVGNNVGQQKLLFILFNNTVLKGGIVNIKLLLLTYFFPH